MAYQIILDPLTQQPGQVIRRISDGATIPPDPNNMDYAAFLEWVAAGNTPATYDPDE